jgi:hypothetical protein
MAGWTAVIGGVGGGLISRAFVEQDLLPGAMADAQLARFERQVSRWWRQVHRSLGPASSARSVHDIAVAPLLEMLGHERPTMAPHSLGLLGSMKASNAVLITLPWQSPLGTAWRGAALGIAAGADWAIVSNGHALTVVDCTRTWARHGIEFDLGVLMSNAKAIAALWLLCQARTLSGAGGRSLREVIRQSDAHAARVCNSLGDGVLHALPRLASSLADGTSHHPGATLDQALTVLYRVLFLLFAEARGMVPVWHELYRDAYSIDTLARIAAGGKARGVWPALQAISRLAHAGCKAGDLEVTAFNGRLFSPRHAPLADRRRIPDAVAAEVLLSLATETGPSGRRRISYHDLGVEQLGSVYERVLEYEPVAAGRAIRLSRTSIERKTTGSFYTPRSITEFLVRRTLAPLAEHKHADEILRLRILDPSMGSGAFLVAACRYLADQCERAYIEEGVWSAAEVPAADRAALTRQIGEQCLFGVDLNPVAVQLARLSLWLTTLASDRPLTFLDHHLVAGNSLLGARLADLGRPFGVSRPRHPLSLPLFADQIAEILADRVLPARLRLAMTPSDSVTAVRDKERWLADLAAPHGPIARWSAAADAWCAAVLSPAPRPASGLVREWLAFATGSPTTMPASELTGSLGRARVLAAGYGAFHWELAFPEIFFDGGGQLRPDGGFDAIIGNPPWDMLRADTGSEGDRATAKTATIAQLRFFRDSGVYGLQGNGHVNRYQLFLERALQLAKPGGRIGLILPSGIGTDRGSSLLRRHLFDRTTIDTWLGFDNRHRIFPIHRSMRFVLLSTATAGRTETLTFRCALNDTHVLDAEASDAPALTIARSRLESWSADLSIPEVPDETSLGILSGIANRIPALGDTKGWNARFGRELNATDDRPHFVQLADARPRPLPIVEGKLLAPFQVHVERASSGIPAAVAARLLGRDAVRRPRLAYRDVASATNKLTLITAMLPAGAASTHTVFVLKTAADEQSQRCLMALLNSFVANFLVRLRVMTHVTTALMARLPVPCPAADSPEFATLVELSQTLERDGIDRAADAYARVNAIAAQLYGLTHEQFRYVAETFPLIDQRIRSRSIDIFTSLHRPMFPRLE